MRTARDQRQRCVVMVWTRSTDDSTPEMFGTCFRMSSASSFRLDIWFEFDSLGSCWDEMDLCRHLRHEAGDSERWKKKQNTFRRISLIPDSNFSISSHRRQFIFNELVRISSRFKSEGKIIPQNLLLLVLLPRKLRNNVQFQHEMRLLGKRVYD